MKKLVFLFFSLFSIHAFAQDEATDFDETVYDDITPKHQFSIDLGLPNTALNKPFSSIMQGIVKVSPYYQHTLENGIGMGIGFNYSYLKINQFRVNNPINGGMHNMALYGKIAYEKFHSMRFGTEYALRVGYNQATFFSDSNNVVNNGNVVKGGLYIEPTVSVVLTADEWTSFRFYVGYGVLSHGFSPRDIGEQSNLGYDVAEFDKRTQIFSAGFGFTYYFKQYK